MTTKDQREKLHAAISRIPLREKIAEQKETIDALRLHIRLLKEASRKVIEEAMRKPKGVNEDFSLLIYLKELKNLTDGN